MSKLRGQVCPLGWGALASLSGSELSVHFPTEKLKLVIPSELGCLGRWTHTSLSIALEALCPGAPVTDPQGCVPEPQSQRQGIGVW